ncbi:MAG: ABC transporter permease [Christensenellales bacterium]|jgi:ribose transport system permease protein
MANQSKGVAFSRNPIVKFVKTNLAMLIGLIVMYIIFAVCNDKFFTVSNFINVLRQISINSIVAFGMTYAILITGIDLSVGSIMAVTGCLSVLMIVNGISIPIAFAAALVLGIIIGFINGFIIAKGQMPAFIVTLAMLTIARGSAYLMTGGKPTRISLPAFENIGNGYLGPIPIPVIITIICLILASLLLNRTIFGRNVYAIGGNREAAKFSGINIDKVEIAVYAISGFLASLAGVIVAARLSSAQPTAGEGQELDAIAAVVLGGTSFSGGYGKIGGTMIGALIIGFLSNGLNMIQVNFYWQLVVKGIVILAAVYFDTFKKRNKA